MPLISTRSHKLLRARLKELRGLREAAVESGIPRREPGAVVEASDAQQQIYLHSLLATDVCLYNEPVTIHHMGALDVRALENGLNEVLHRHEAWRTSFHWSDGRIIQKIAPDLRVRLEVEDLRHIDRSKREPIALKLAAADAVKPFTLSELPLFRYRLVRLDDHEHRLFLTLHHLIFDGVSLYQIFLPELQHLYTCYKDGRDPKLSPLPFQYADYCYWQQNLNDKSLSLKLRYWQDKLTGDLVPLNLPLDRPRPQVRSYKGAMEVFLVPNDIVYALINLAQLHNATLFIVLLAAFHVVLYRLTGQMDQVVGSATSTRNQEYTDQIIGLF